MKLNNFIWNLIFVFSGETPDVDYNVRNATTQMGRATGGRELFGDVASDIVAQLNPRKFRQWKLMIKFFQTTPKKWRDFQNYGCHCVPEGSRKIAEMGYGEPVDAVDASCRSFHQCYRCLDDEHSDEAEGCSGDQTRYKFKGSISSTGEREATCSNTPGSCKYNVCQCDLELAKRLSTAVTEWDVSHHSKFGGFDREATCIKNGQGNGHEFEECCGDKNTFPLNQIRRSNQCCVGTESKPQSQC